jgi:hypothetical protein
MQSFQTESVFAVSGGLIQDIISSPWILFTVPKLEKRYEPLAQFFSSISHVDALVEKFREQLDSHIDSNPDFMCALLEVGQHLFRHGLQIECNRILSDQVFLDSKSLITPADQQLVLRKILKAKQSHQDKSLLTLEDLCQDDGVLKLELCAVIVREGLRQSRLTDIEFPTTSPDFYLRNMQHGQHLFTGVKKHSPDHMNCILEKVGYVTMVHQYLPTEKICTPLCFVNHLVFYGTGQGPQTEEFYKIPPIFLKKPSNITDKLHRAITQRGMKWTEVKNMAQWGTCNDWLSWRGHGKAEDPAT